MSRVLLFMLLISVGGRAHAGECFGIGGALLGRYQIAESGLERDGIVTASAGGACEVLDGHVWGVAVGAFAGAVLADAANPIDRPVVGGYVGIDYSDAVSVGVAPHWETAKPVGLRSSWAVGLMVTTRFGEIGDAIASWFSDGVQAGAVEP